MKKIKHLVNDLLVFSLSTKATQILLGEIILGISVILVFTYAFTRIISVTFIDQRIVQFDDFVSTIIQSFRSPLLTEVMIFISLLGADIILIVATIIVVFMRWRKHKKESILFTIMLVFGAILNIVLKSIFQRARPTFDPLLVVSDYSFPSGHAMNSLVFYATVAYFMYYYTKNALLSVLVLTLCIVLILLIGISRVYLGVHFPSDVIAGYIAGTMWFVFVLLVERTLTYFNLYKTYKLKNKLKDLVSK